MSEGNVYNTVFLLVNSSFFLGLHPNYFEQIGNRITLKTNKCCSLVIAIHFVTFSILAYLGSLAHNPVTDGQLYNFNTFAKLLILAVTYVAAFAVFAILILSFIFKKCYTNLLNDISALDKILTKLGQPINHQLDFYMALVLTISGPLVILLNIAMELWNIPRENIDPIPSVVLACHLLPFLYVHQGETQFAVSNVILRRRFKAVNNILQNLHERRIRKKSANNGKNFVVINSMIMFFLYFPYFYILLF